MSLEAFQQCIKERTGVAIESQELLTGFPPKLIEVI